MSIEIQDNTLTVSGERKAEHETRERGLYRVVLTVRIPKPEERKPRRVSISPGSGNGRPALEGTAEEK